ncbi:MAG TPA: hypothetical protein VFQ77_02715 [Pseudonocardiaceae bacterium]|jgi:hypothetical protein|nr:hypothetical protein [Pseudonocardiaceae bacterium]
MSRISTWIGKNADGVIALVLAACIAVLAWVEVLGTSQVDSAVLLILAVLATTLLRDRVRAGFIERNLAQVLELVRALDTKLTSTKTALDAASNVRVLAGEEVTQALADARRDTERWTFKGGTGTFIRAVTLPECVERARRDGRPLTVRLEIVDPTNDSACEHYALFRRSLSARPDGTGEIWTIDRTRKESLATILAACWYRQRYRLLTVEVGLSSTVTTFRWDLSSRYLIITQQDPREPALLIKRGWVYYDRYATELLTSLEQSHRLPIEQAAKDVTLSDEPTIEETQKLFIALHLPLPASYDDRAISEIISKAIQAKNPYE